jgi:ferric-dicitrate binding protein FerR (iron transport regulator)
MDLLRFIEGDCSPAEAAALATWIAADPARGALLAELRTVWRLSGQGRATRSWDIAAARERLHAARSPSPARTRSFVAMRIAAAIVVVVGAAAAWRALPRAVPFREYVTAPGQRSQLTFLDGTRVLLAVDSRLRVPRDYGVRQRLVDLEGEAYFAVRHDPSRPFVVRTSRGTTEDLGTEFDVRAYPDEDLTVVVAKGRVVLRGPELLVRARERGVIDALGVATHTRGVAVDRYVAWTRGALRFDDVPLHDVIRQLARWYDIDIQLDDTSLARERLTIAFDTPSADEALAALAGVLDVRVTRAGRSVRLL